MIKITLFYEEYPISMRVNIGINLIQMVSWLQRQKLVILAVSLD